MDAAPTVFDQLQRVAALLDHDLSRSLEPLGLSRARMHLLWTVHHVGPRSQQQLATALGVTPRNVTGLVDALVASGHVVRAPHPSDRRAFVVTLTDSGSGFVAEAAAEHARTSRDLLESVDAGDRDAFTRGLAAVVDRLERTIRDAEQAP